LNRKVFEIQRDTTNGAATENGVVSEIIGSAILLEARIFLSSFIKTLFLANVLNWNDNNL
jgi:hypothetical protein